MSRVTIYKDERVSVIGGQDVVLGKFLQVFDKQLENETPEGEGLVYDWSEEWGVETNLTGISSDNTPEAVADMYVKRSKEK